MSATAEQNPQKKRRPPLTAKRRRLYLLIAAAIILGLSVTLILNAFRDSLVFFYTPSDIVGTTKKPVPQDRMIRIGGLVEEGSVKKTKNAGVSFAITDLSNRIAVRYQGILPDLFREGQGVVTQGKFGPDQGGNKMFIAHEVLAKHDENYMPKEVSDAIKKSGKWQDGGKRATPKVSK
ncbi:MAG: cytochrome c maturation protein CcmE [Alphaproteobacteria bacterium]